ncbi:lipocalin-like protein [Thermosporothrix hazakensis]|jgi:hypothetical protein|uniref:Lipocalin-like protein n=1 Tax=Thermosporothrix hazakensis TaxID=644383 RepID=A0A326TQS6_THEHA|nr:lipocalin-like domain-containing protein [Thermosporothrix hazakensis]PZW18318.1 lipocalin-like protein [Thermosporothrix hazakensis]GCE51444.1 hypothetical protein KTH_63130 [Thermosporothrix hazakensis]
MTAETLVGTWRLLSFEIRSANGQMVYPLGQDAVGYLVYTADGYMFLAMMRADRPHFASDDPGKATPAEKLAASDSYMTYCGTYHYQDNTVIHHVELSLFPNWKGTHFERIVEFDDNRLILKTAPQLVFGAWQTGYLIWTRA